MSVRDEEKPTMRTNLAFFWVRVNSNSCDGVRKHPTTDKKNNEQEKKK